MAQKKSTTKKDESPVFTLKLRLKVEPWQADILNKRFEACRQLQNALIAKTTKIWKELKKTRKYRGLIASLNHDKKHPEHDRQIWKEIEKLRKEVGLYDKGIEALATPIRLHFETLITSHMSQKIAKDVWNAWDKFFHGNGKKIHFKKYGQRNSVEGKDNKNSIIFKPKAGVCRFSTWKNNKPRNRAKKKNGEETFHYLDIPVDINPRNMFEVECLSYPIAYCRILREYIRGKQRYFIQIVFKGIKPVKRKKDGSFKHVLGDGDVGIDIGTSTIAYASNTEVYLDGL